MLKTKELAKTIKHYIRYNGKYSKQKLALSFLIVISWLPYCWTLCSQDHDQFSWLLPLFDSMHITRRNFFFGGSLRFKATHCTLWRGHIDVKNTSCNCIAMKHCLQLVFMHWRSRWACCKLMVLKRWCADRKVKRTSRNLWNFTIRRRRAWQNIWNVFHLSLS